jgi:hypothetical protein
MKDVLPAKLELNLLFICTKGIAMAFRMLSLLYAYLVGSGNRGGKTCVDAFWHVDVQSTMRMDGFSSS